MGGGGAWNILENLEGQQNFLWYSTKKCVSILWHNQAMGSCSFHTFEGAMNIFYAFEERGPWKCLPSENISTPPPLHHNCLQLP